MAQANEKHQNYTAEYTKGDWDRVAYLDNPHIDNLMSAFLSLSAEFWAMKRRQMVTERLLEKKRTINQAAIDAYNPTEEEREAWPAERDDFIERTLGVLTRVGGKVSASFPTGKMPPLKKD
jgi:hypothetical protein